MDRNLPSALESMDALRAGTMSSTDLVEEAIARIERDDEALHAICVRDLDRARDAAHAADRARARGEDGALLGLPITVKESFDVAGLPTTWGMPEFRDHVPDDDAVAVARVRAAGAVVLGKTTVPFMLQDLQSYNELHGTTVNPWDATRTPGGSSGGSAAALVAGFGALSLGSDIGGSLRTPAHFCGIHAHKPTLGLVANRGMSPPGSPALPVDLDLAVVGPMARTAADLTLLLDVIAGPDPLTRGRAYRLELPPARHDRLDEFRVLVVGDHPCLPTGAAVRAGVDRVAEALASAGARVEHHSALLPDLRDAAAVYQRLLFAGAAARFPDEAYEALRAQAAVLPADDATLGAERLRGMVAGHRDWLAANDRREAHRLGWRRLFAEFDAVLCPVTPTPAFPHDHDPDLLARRIDIDGVAYPYLDQLVWAGLATMPGLPATAIPAGRTASGLPVGVQLIGPMYEDRTPLRLAELIEEDLGTPTAAGG